MKIKSYLPVFPGFYNTIFEVDEEPYIEEGKTYNDYQWDYKAYEERVAKACVEWVEKELKKFVNAIKFELVQSPREYNFANDSIYVEYSLKSLRVVREYIRMNREEFRRYLNEHYTPYPGFIPSHSRNVDEWIKEADNEHKFGSILNFILYNEMEDPERDMFDSISDRSYVEGELKEVE
jgi:hypothetical protein